MNIAHLLPASAVFPLQKHNGRYDWALRLARQQAARGHDVTIYAGHGSTDSTSSVAWRNIGTDDEASPNDRLIDFALSHTEHDVFHSHFDYLAFVHAHNTTRPVMTTQHWFPDATIARHIRSHPSKNAVAVPVTRYMHEVDQQLGIPSSDVIYHGIDLGLFAASYAPRSSRYLCVGRVAPHKGTLETVKFAYELGLELDIIGKINKKDEPYWQEIHRYVDGERINYLGQMPQAAVAAVMRRARAMLFTPASVEAFGQTIIEAQACGTPVITIDSGANSELIEHSVTGFVCASTQDLRTATELVDTLDARACRRFAERFDLQHMIANYDALYQGLVSHAAQ